MQSVLLTDRINEVSALVDPAVIDYINDGQIRTFESFENFDIIAFDWYDIGDIMKKPEKVMIYIDEDDIFFLCPDCACHNGVSALFSTEATNERVLYRFFTRLILGDDNLLDSLEDNIASLEDAVLMNDEGSYTDDIIKYRKRFLRMRKYYEQLVTIFEELLENENGLLTPACLRYINILNLRAARLLRSVTHLGEYVTQVREAYQAQIDIEQNNLMKFFTVITSLFLPLTLVVGWYGMNFDMPELEWKYGYAAVIVLCAAVGVALFVYFKRKKFF